MKTTALLLVALVFIAFTHLAVSEDLEEEYEYSYDYPYDENSTLPEWIYASYGPVPVYIDRKK